MLRLMMIAILVLSLIACNGNELTGGDSLADNGQAAGRVDNGAGQPGDGQADGPHVPAAVDELLAQLEQAGLDSPAIQADIDYHVDQRLTGDSEHRTGSVKYQADTEDAPAKFYVIFRTLRLRQGPTTNETDEYAFDGRWLTITKHRIKQMTRYEIVAEGERVEAFTLGRETFPLPFGQTAETMNTYFHVTTQPTDDDAPAETDYLLLIPRAEHAEELNFIRMEMWIDRTTHLPVKLISTDKSENVTTVVFTNIDTSPTFNAADFHPPRRAGWQYSQERLDHAGDATP